MAWTATVIDVTKAIDCITVMVRYTDGKRVLDERYKSYGPPDPDWIPLTTKKRIEQLNGIDAANISTGTPSAPTDDSAKSLFFERLGLFRRLHELVEMGLIPSGNATYTNLKTWLTNNISNYIDKL